MFKLASQKHKKICEQLFLQIVKQFISVISNKFSQCKTAKTLNMSSSSVHHIMKRSWKSAKISEWMGQGQNKILDACNL